MRREKELPDALTRANRQEQLNLRLTHSIRMTCNAASGGSAIRSRAGSRYRLWAADAVVS